MTGGGPLRKFRALRLLLPLVAIGCALLLFLGVGLIIGFGGLGGRSYVGPCDATLGPLGSTADAAGPRRVTSAAQLSDEQRENAALIIGVAKGMGLPPRAWLVALATAMQESTLRNLDYGDRDSLGLFQQRPSQGWGTKTQVMNATHAAGAFYSALVKIPGYQNLAITEAAQQVQHSASPTAYAQHETPARALASALTGETPAAFTCVTAAPTLAAATVKGPSVAARATAASAALTGAFGSALTTSTPGPNGTVQVSASGNQSRVAQLQWAAAEWL